MFRFFNPNPQKNMVGDCVIRAISKSTNQSWNEVYADITALGYDMKDMPSSNQVWSTYLWNRGYNRYTLPNTCPPCYTVKQFTQDNPKGNFILATGTHVIAVEDGDYFDTWDSGNEVPIYYWRRN